MMYHLRAGALSCLLALAIGCGDEPAGDRWEILESEYPASFLGVWGSSVDDVWIVGNDARESGDGLGPTVLHYDGAAWTRLDTGLRRIDLWWVFGFAGGPVFFGGSNGTILRYQAGVFETIPTPSTSLVFGIWGSAPDDVWAVGGQFGARNGFAWRYDGVAFAPVALPPDLAEGTVWKVAGRAADDVWMSCSAGAVLHWDGQALVREDVGTTEEQLFSIGVSSDVVVTLGGNFSNGRIYERVGGTWTDKTIEPTDPLWRGVSATDAGIYAVGQFGTIAERTGAGWSAETLEETGESFHAGWVDPTGALWAVGGKFDRIPAIDGVIARKGAGTIAPIEP